MTCRSRCRAHDSACSREACGVTDDATKKPGPHHETSKARERQDTSKKPGAHRDATTEPAEQPAPPSDLRGPELARAVLDAAKARRASRSPTAGRGGSDSVTGRDGVSRGRTGKVAKRARGYSGAGPDPRDP